MGRLKLGPSYGQRQRHAQPYPRRRPLSMRVMPSSSTAPITATKNVHRSNSNGAQRPNAEKTKPPSRAPRTPMMTFITQPRRSPINAEATQPAKPPSNTQLSTPSSSPPPHYGV